MQLLGKSFGNHLGMIEYMFMNDLMFEHVGNVFTEKNIFDQHVGNQDM